MERTPIISQPNEVAVRLVEMPLTVRGMLPSYQYQFQSGQVSEEATQMYEELVNFLITNEELAVNEPTVSREDYIKGFQKALAMTRLWIDSIYMQGNDSQP